MTNSLSSHNSVHCSTESRTSCFTKHLAFRLLFFLVVFFVTHFVFYHLSFLCFFFKFSRLKANHIHNKQLRSIYRLFTRTKLIPVEFFFTLSILHTHRLFAFITRESRMLRASLPSSGRLSVRPSVCLSHSWAVSKRCKLGSRNLHCGLPQGL